jgi:phospholipid/cholesterol/gamma-HCH transport system permease protein
VAPDLFSRLGRVLLEFVSDLGRFFVMQGSVVRWLLATLGGWVRFTYCTVLRRPGRSPFEARETVEQMVSIGVNSVPVVLVTALFTGMVLALQTGYTLDSKLQGISQFLGGMVTLSMIRELGPVLTSLIVAGRVGSAMAAELGTMRVTEQIDALETLGTNPIRYLVVPRVIASLFMLPVLVLFADAVGVLGGFVIAQMRYGQSAGMYLENAQSMVVLGDLFSGLFKTAFFGVIIAMVSCYKGFNTTGGAEGVGRATTSAVVVSSMGILMADYMLTAAMSAF